MEHTELEKKKLDWYAIRQVIFLVLLSVAIGALIATILTLHKYKDMLNNPMGYNMDRFNLNYCTCYDKSNKIVMIQGLSYNESYEQYKPKPEYRTVEYPNISDLNLTVVKT